MTIVFFWSEVSTYLNSGVRLAGGSELIRLQVNKMDFPGQLLELRLHVVM